jgi:hypothetical protein
MRFRVHAHPQRRRRDAGRPFGAPKTDGIRICAWVHGDIILS